MRTRTLVAFAVVALSVIAAVMVACSDNGPSCKPGLLTLQVELDGTANFADSVVVSSSNPSFTQTFMHTGDGPNLFDVDVDFGGHFPAGQTVTLLVRAMGGSTLLGENIATIHLGDSCSTGFVTIRAETLDAGPTD